MNTKSPCIILGVDPGTRITGFGIIQSNQKIEPIDFGCIRPPSNDPLHKRYWILHQSLESIIQKHLPDAICVESQFVKKNAQSAMKLAMAKAVVYLIAAKYNIPLFEYAPKKAKLAVVGNGKASKLQVQKMTQAILGLKAPPEPEDAADALAIAIAHANSLNICTSI
ncbi:MAG: crossover junction endodeoxyribonuclease RuvC [Chlamydiae bacterium CG10_big_fil_rev_8_21_14_0_10_35_9]|nr:MAG: crossover junction endodeoxyribonuclease RuvC [Chlamydiae bacterium CG10_big_fil_rev_8_21_14_0_10_35_9]